MAERTAATEVGPSLSAAAAIALSRASEVNLSSGGYVDSGESSQRPEQL